MARSLRSVRYRTDPRGGTSLGSLCTLAYIAKMRQAVSVIEDRHDGNLSPAEKSPSGCPAAARSRAAIPLSGTRNTAAWRSSVRVGGYVAACLFSDRLYRVTAVHVQGRQVGGDRGCGERRSDWRRAVYGR